MDTLLLLVGAGLLLAPIASLAVGIRLWQRVRVLEQRLGNVEDSLDTRWRERGLAATAPTPATPETPHMPGAPAEVVPPVTAPTPPIEAWDLPEPTTTIAAAGEFGWAQLERRLGGTWLNRIGALVLVLGIGFFLKYAFDHSWITPVGRVSFGIVIGIVFLLLGERLQRAAYRLPAQGVVGAGIATLYLSVYAGYALYALVGQSMAFGFMVLVTTTAMALAIHHDTRAIAMLANVGGFVTPIVLGSDRDAAVALFGYLAILDAGMLASAYWRRWTELHLVSFVLTHALYWAWFDAWYRPSKLSVALGGATVFFGLFALLGPILAAGRRLTGVVTDLRTGTALVTLAVPIVYFVAGRAVLWPIHSLWLGVLCLAVAGVYLVLGAWVARNAAQEGSGGPHFAVLHLAIAVAFLTLTFPVQFTEHAVTIAWSIEAIALLWGGFQLGTVKLRWGALAVLVLAALRWLWTLGEWTEHRGAFVVDHPAALAALFLVAACLAVAGLYARSSTSSTRPERFVRPAAIVAALSAVALLLTLELHQHRLGWPAGYVSVVSTAVWTVAAIPMLTLAPADRSRVMLWATTLVLAGAGGTAMTVNAWQWAGATAAAAIPVLNLRFFGGLLIAALYGLSAGKTSHLPLGTAQERAWLGATAAAIAALFLLWHLSAEIYFLKLEGLLPRDAWKARNMALSILWTLYAFIAMGVGIQRRQSYLRFGAIGLFGLTVGKVLLVDLSQLDAVYRILSFVVLGGLLLVASFLYTKYRERIAE